MNKEQLTARAEELGLDVQALNAANDKGTATNAELKTAIGDKEAELNTAALKEEAEKLKIENIDTLDTDEKLQAAIDAKKPADPADDKSKGEDNEEASKEEAPATWKDSEDREWFFKPNAPKTINIDGRPLTQAEILASEDIISELAYGNSSFLTQKY